MLAPCINSKCAASNAPPKAVYDLQRGVPNVNTRVWYVRCPVCKMTGPTAWTSKEAEALWDMLPRVKVWIPKDQDPTVRNLVSAVLASGGFHGLYNEADGCHCILEECMPCHGECPKCLAGYEQPQPTGDFPRRIQPNKSGEEDGKRTKRY